MPEKVSSGWIRGSPPLTEPGDILPYLQEIVTDTISCQMIVVHVSMCCLFKIHFNSIPSTLSRSFKCFHLFRPSEYDYV